MTFLIDMNLPIAWRDMLSFDDCQAIHWSEVGRGNDSDETILSYAQANDFIIVTQDLDFGEILQHTGARGPSVIQVRLENIDPVRCKDAVLAILRAIKKELIEGALVTLSPLKHRMRILPFPQTF
ncbi:MAG: hypothetical protein EAZ81_13215 [Verrucomicrobia bacterium]|nr:MAG: hypothetical protein EAZ81_13215 [Verrucomicrobiota bacterium]